MTSSMSKRRPLVRTRAPYGARRVYRGRSAAVKVTARSLSNTVWITNPANQDIIGCNPQPWIGGTNAENRYLNINSATDATIVNIMNSADLAFYQNVFRFMHVKSFWYKYTPGIIPGSVGHNDNIGQFSNGSVTGTITVMPTNDLAQDLIDYPRTELGLHRLKTNRRSTTFNMYKKQFGRFVPKIRVDVADGGKTMTKYIPLKVELGVDDFLAGGYNVALMIMCQVPVEAGFEYFQLNPFSGGNWPSEGYNAVLGKFEMGATIFFSGLRI